MKKNNNVIQFPGSKEPSPCTDGWSVGPDRNIILTINESEIIALSLVLTDFLAHYELQNKRPPEIVLDLCDLQNKLAEAWNDAK